VSEISKYDMFIEELNALEKQIYYFIQKGTELLDSNQALNNRITLLERENDSLKKKINEIESKVSKSFGKSEDLFGNESFNLEEKEALKNKISELIAKIDYHLRS
jgi:predicted  nucleic acid-binding Zn-ribbon protein